MNSLTETGLPIHLSEITITSPGSDLKGQQIQAGQCLGTVGQTGNATGPHLHFELLHAGVRYDPTRALAKAGLQAEP